MIEEIHEKAHIGLDDYASVVHLAGAVAELRAEAAQLVPKLKGRTVWMLNSTAQGGGVAEMLPRVISLLEELGVRTRWLVMGTERPGFFDLTKRIHNLIHGSGDPVLTPADRALYSAVSDDIARELAPRLHSDDVLVAHDPQPAGAGARVAASVGVNTVWRCHIGLDEDLPQTRAAWDFLEPYLGVYDQTVFTATEYIPHYLTRHVALIPPGIDPLSEKNRELSAHELTGVLVNSRLLAEYAPVVTPAFARPAERLQAGRKLRSSDAARRARPLVPSHGLPDLALGQAQGLQAAARRLRVPEAAPGPGVARRVMRVASRSCGSCSPVPSRPP